MRQESEIKVLLTGLPYLISSGLKAMLIEEGFDCLVDVESQITNANCIIVGVDTYLNRYEQLYPLRKRIIIWNSSLWGNENPELLHITLSSTHEDILNKVNRIIESRETESAVLTKREVDILRQISLGLSNKEIAEKLFISEHTVATHRKHITSKLGIRTASGLSLYAMMHGLI